MHLLHLAKKFLERGPLTPLSVDDFRPLIAKVLVLQLIVSLLSAGIYFFGISQFSMDIEMGTLILFFYFEILTVYFLIWKRFLFRRLLDAYPDISAANKLLVLASLLFPLTFFGLIIHLYFKRPLPNEKTPWAFSNPIKFSVLLLIVAFLLPLSGYVVPIFLQNKVGNLNFKPIRFLSFFFLDPVTYYVSSCDVEFATMLHDKSFPDRKDSAGPIKKLILDAQNDQISSTGMILGSTMIVDYYVRDKEKQLLGGNTIAAEMPLHMNEDILSLMEIWDQSRPVAFRNNPIALLSPLSGLEVATISLIEDIFIFSFDHAFSGMMRVIVNAIISQSAVLGRPDLSSRAKNLYTRADAMKFRKKTRSKMSQFARKLFGSESRAAPSLETY